MSAALVRARLEDPVTRHMRSGFCQIRPDQTVSQALASLRERQPEGRIIYFYVVDAEGRLCGVVPTRRLLLSPPESLVSDVMVRRVVAIPASASVLDACEFFTLHRLLAFPVIDEAGRMIGVVDVELYTDELSGLDEGEPRQDDLFQLIGVHLSEARQGSPLGSFRQRFPWLLCNLGGGLLAAVVSGLYEEELKRALALALFIPVVLALAEGVAIQSVSLALQALQGRKPTWRRLLDRAGREVVAGLCLGLASGTLAALAALGWIGQARLALCLLGGVAGGVACAAVLGLALPNVLRLLRLDPRVAAGPIALALADMVTLLLYLNLARRLIP